MPKSERFVVAKVHQESRAEEGGYMTFREAMAETGYDTKTTFWDDFSIADRFGNDEIQDTFNRAFNEWKSNAVFVTELALVLNHKSY